MNRYTLSDAEYSVIREALINCPVFMMQSELMLFMRSNMRPWYTRTPGIASVDGRVNGILAMLVDAYYSNSDESYPRRNALSVFMEKLIGVYGKENDLDIAFWIARKLDQ